MISHGKHRITIQTEPASEFGQSRAFVVCRMTKAGINIVSHHSQVRDRAGILVEIPVNDICIAIVTGDQAEGRIRVFVNARMKAGIYPGDNAWKISLNVPKQFSMGLRALAVPFVMTDVLRLLMKVNLPLH